MIELAGDCASDAPLSSTLRTLAVERADDVVYGLGALALERRTPDRDDALALVVGDAEARRALERSIARCEARVRLVEARPGWPQVIPARAVVRADELVMAAERARGQFPRAYVTVAGAVKTPSLLAADPLALVERLVALCGGALDDDWVAIAGGAPGGRLVERDLLARDVAPLLLVLPARHELVRRLRTPIGEWLKRATSACEGCRACTDACPPHKAGLPLEPHQVVWTLATLRDDGVDLQRTLACTGCGLCDAMCPQALSPRTLVRAVAERLRAGGVSATSRVRDAAGGLDRALLTLRLGLGPYDRAPRLAL